MAWFEEALYPAAGQRLRVDRTLLERRDGGQHVLVFENAVFGRVLALDGVVQTTERDEFVYHEMLTHLPILAHGAARRVLIVGGGDGGALEEALKHRALERVTMVEIEPAVIELCRTHLPSISNGAFDDPRAELVIADGARFVRESGGKFDVVIVDSTDPHGPGAALFSAEFYAACKERLTEGGVLVAQSGVPCLQPDELRATAARLRPLFRDVAAFAASVPSYFGGAMAFGWATDDPAKRRVAAAELRRRFDGAGALTTRYYSPEVHAAAFVLPRFIDELLRA
jgi:spermidine synthase